MHMNGNDFEVGRLMGQLVSTSERQTILLDQIHEIHIETRDMIATLPHVLGEKIAVHSRKAEPETTSVRDVTELVRALFPVLALGMAVFGKSAWPQMLPLLRDIVTMAAGGGH